MFCGNCGKKLKEGSNFCGRCGNKVLGDKSKKNSENNKNINIFMTILKILKNGLRVFLMLCLLLFILVYLLDNNWFSICFILCFILLIPRIAGLLYKKFKINRIIKYIAIVLLFIVGLVHITPVSETNNGNSSIDDKNIKENEVVNNDKKDDSNAKANKKEESEIITIINRNAYIKKNSNGKIRLEKEDSGYVATIPFDTFIGYDDELDCAIDGIKVINTLKKNYKDSVDNKISKYVLEFYDDDKFKFESIYVNAEKNDSINQLTIVSENGKEKTITQADIDKYYQELKNQNSSSNNTENTTTFDENNINKSITCNNKKITVKKIKRVTKNESSYVPTGKEWIGIYIVFENKSKEDMSYYESDFNLVNGNGEVIKPVFNIIKGVLDHDRINNGTLTAGGRREGYVMFDNDSIGDKNLSLRVVCQDNIIADDEIKTIKLHN